MSFVVGAHRLPVDWADEWNTWALWTSMRLLRSARDAEERDRLVRVTYLYRLLMSLAGPEVHEEDWHLEAERLNEHGQFASAYAYGAACDAAKCLCLVQVGDVTRELAEMSVKKALDMMEASHAHH